MKPVGCLIRARAPALRRRATSAGENLMADAYSMVGFQNHLRYGEQARVLRMIPGLENAEFLQFGQIHRNTYINGPRVLSATMQMREHPNIASSPDRNHRRRKAVMLRFGGDGLACGA